MGVVVVKWQRWWYIRWLRHRSRSYQSFSQMMVLAGLKRLKKLLPKEMPRLGSAFESVKGNYELGVFGMLIWSYLSKVRIVVRRTHMNIFSLYVRETMEKAFWDGVTTSIQQDNDDRVVELMKEARDELCDMAPRVANKILSRNSFS
nr:T-complex protein 11 [Tanacetum cinerariifolium]GEY48264.1 T-complex protein 11 [Tanacetum cinerariifolium]GEY50966.1 T-complex protein 11 [Tanacetum cinerariifolium]